jgi:hypothetical protein
MLVETGPPSKLVLSLIRKFKRYGELIHPSFMQLKVIALIQQHSIGNQYQVRYRVSLFDRFDYSYDVLTEKWLTARENSYNRTQPSS